jgi:quinol-cytochrome oxidoreductase complex cytochrome b subunit
VAHQERSKTYSILGIASGTTVQVSDPTTLDDTNSVPSTPFLTVRLLVVTLATVAACLILALVFAAPLEEAANPEVTPNPAKAPWYFLGLQELVGYSALVGGVIVPGVVIVGLGVIPFLDKDQARIGVWFTNADGRRWGIIGAVFGMAASSLCVAVAVLFPLRDLLVGIESQLFFDVFNPATFLLLLFVGFYFLTLKISGSKRSAAIATFCGFITAFILLTYVGTALRGPNWDFYWPWQPWPEHPITF